MNRPHFDYHALYLALDEEREARGMSWQQVANAIGGSTAGRHRLSPSTLRNTARGGPMEADGILAMVRWLGFGVERFAADVPKRMKTTSIGGGLRRFDSRAFFSAVDEKRMAKGQSWKQVALEIGGFTPGMLRRLANRGRMSADQVVLLSSWLERAPEELTYVADS